ncbi:MAG: DNA topoisomerase (ATP-hydrolyzing) subunit B [Phycisphaerales bacterium]
MPDTPASEHQPVKVSGAAASGTKRNTKPSDVYGADQIKILEGLEAVRKRPGMYIGDTGVAGLHHLVWEAVDNSIDECMAGRATTVAVRVHADGTISVTDDGSGIPIQPKSHPNPAYNGKPAVELVMTVLHAGGKFGEENSAYKVSGGLHGVGISCVNALSERLDVEIYKEGKIHKISFERGITAEPLHVVGDIDPGSARKSGTRVTFKPDPQIFPDTTFNQLTLYTRLREMAYLNPGVAIRFTDERVGPDGKIKDETFRFDEGLKAFVEHLNHNKGVLHDVIALSGENEEAGLSVDIALQYNDSYNELVQCFANNIRTVDGGTHLSGFKTAITRCLNNYSKKAGILREKDPVPSGDDLREGLAAIISVKLPDPQFEGQTKGKLRNTEVEGFVAQIVSDRLLTWMEENPAQAKKICQKGVLAAQAREAARKARELTRRKSALDSGSMPHKLRDCTTKDVDRSEMFIVEGDSAGGSATQGRDVETQAILPLRGKLLNVEKARLDKILAFEEIRTLISALKCGIGPDFDIAKLRYGRVIIMTDADVDGSHIRTLLLTFFFRQMPELIRRGRIYIAQPPLYQITRNKKSQYVINERQMADVLVDLGLEGASLIVRDITGAINEAGEVTGARVVQTIEGERLTKLVRVLRRLNELAEIVERRGIRFLDLLSQRMHDPTGGHGLPSHRLLWQGGEAFAWSDEQAIALAKEHGLHLPDLRERIGGDEPAGSADHGPTVDIRELHENRELMELFRQLGELGIDIDDWGLSAEEAITGERLPTKYAWSTPHRARKRASATDGEAGSAGSGAGDGDGEGEGEDSGGGADAGGASAPEGRLVEAANIPGILETLLDVGRRGMEVKRFKGLGEMDPEQLWETTMDKSVRTLLRVTWDDASAADELFTILMGENVESRRTYIEDHALEVKQLDV